ncbi:MAG: BACON domain-containing protein [Mariniphaga sp.]|nr:BACON domain-containing protein [Mariniphaga sp.]
MKKIFPASRLYLILFCISLFVSILYGCTSEPPFSKTPPEDVTRRMDRDQMLWQMGITIPDLPLRLEYPNAPKNAFPSDSLNPEGNWTDDYGHTIVRSSWGLWNNYDDTEEGLFPGPNPERLGDYTPIDLLKMNNGNEVKTVEDWWEKRRPEILNDVQEHLYGKFPSKELLPEVTFTVTTTKGGRGNSAYIQKEITGKIDISGYPEVRDKPLIEAILRIPASAKGPVPVIVGFGGSPERLWRLANEHGWGACSFNPNSIQPDNGIGLTSYLIGLVNKGNWRKPDDWGSIGAWSWGISRLLDYFETDDNVNEKAVGLTGHSRYGKATLYTMATEPRLAIAFPSDGGSLGTAINRRHWGQDLENSTWENEYHWMAGNFFKWAGELVPGQYLPRKIEECPVDAHSLLALCAPRPLLLNGGNGSSWTDPYGQYLTTKYATPVYEFLGVKGIVMPDPKPIIDVGYIEGGLAYRYHNGGHTDAPEWPTFFEFAAKFIDAPTLSVSDNIIILGKNGGSEQITISANTDWDFNNTADWVNVARSSENSELLNITASPNNSDKGKSANVIIESEGHKINIHIYQATINPVLTTSLSEFTLSGKEDSQANIIIASNTAWKVESEENWLSFDVIAGVNQQEISIKAIANPQVEKRSGTVILSGLGLDVWNVTITQEEGEPTLRLFSNSVNLGADEGTNNSVFVVTNTSPTITSSADWISGEVTSGGRFSRLNVNYLENNTGANRKAKLSIKVNGLDPQTIEVTQTAK